MIAIIHSMLGKSHSIQRARKSQMSESTCNVRIVTREQKLICVINVQPNDTVEEVKSKIIVCEHLLNLNGRNNH